LGRIENCNLSYFSEKCLADKDGKSQNKYDSGKASDLLKEIVCERMYDIYGNEEEFGDFENIGIDEKLDIISNILEQEGIINSWDFEDLFDNEFEHDVYDTMGEHPEIFGEDSWEYNFRVKTYTPYFHLGALKMCQEKYPNAF